LLNNSILKPYLDFLKKGSPVAGDKILFRESINFHASAGFHRDWNMNRHLVTIEMVKAEQTNG
jgi:hypothetical protein